MRLVIATAAGVVVLVAGGFALLLGRYDAKPIGPAGGPFRGSEPPEGLVMPAFALRDHTGILLRSRDLRGRVTLLTFLDSQCTESCPLIAGEVAGAIDALSPAERGNVVAVAISTDPREDTPRSVERFLHSRHALGRLRYLVGPATALPPLWKAFQILSSLESGNDSLHSAPVRVYGRDGTWLATLHAGADLNRRNLLHDIRAALSRTKA
jgi:cytochrome oxidase Cu insertion factor (SCO1/SenC/PrrC family)